jgi:hypothetical protein
MMDLFKDPYFIVAVGAVVSGLLILQGAAYIQDGKRITGYAHVIVGVQALLVTYYLSHQAMGVMLKGCS